MLISCNITIRERTKQSEQTACKQKVIMILKSAIVLVVLIGLHTPESICKPAVGTTMQNITQIFPISTINMKIPSAGGRTIPVKIIRFRRQDEADSTPAESNLEISSNSELAPRGFRDDFDMKSNNRRVELENRFQVKVPVVPLNDTSANWVAGELIVNEITRRQIKMIDHSQFGPVKSVTLIPSIRSGIMVFTKRYNPEKLATALKFLYGIDAEPNGMISTFGTP